MAVTEELRHKIHEAFRASFGDEVANGMMELLPPVGWADVATKTDLAALEQRIDLRFETVDLRFEALDARFETLEERICGRFERELRIQTVRFGLWLSAVAGVGIAAVELLSRGG